MLNQDHTIGKRAAHGSPGQHAPGNFRFQRREAEAGSGIASNDKLHRAVAQVAYSVEKDYAMALLARIGRFRGTSGKTGCVHEVVQNFIVSEVDKLLPSTWIPLNYQQSPCHLNLTFLTAPY